jgi:hypothetical protein
VTAIPAVPEWEASIVEVIIERGLILHAFPKKAIPLSAKCAKRAVEALYLYSSLTSSSTLGASGMLWS